LARLKNALPSCPESDVTMPELKSEFALLLAALIIALLLGISDF